jgi:DNA-binding beta-propeller fold protein YncE
MVTVRKLEPAECELDSIPVHADPTGLAYDRYTDVLYVADGSSGAILRVSGDDQRCVATIDSGGVTARSRIGGLALRPYGTLYATRVGYGRAGAIFRVEPDGQLEALRGLAPQVWRLGVTYDAHDHMLCATQFTQSMHGPRGGAIIEIDLADGYVSTLLEGFAKPVGVAKLGSAILVTDARQRMVFRIDLVAGRAVACKAIAANLDRPDSICACGPESTLVTAYDDVARRGSVHQLWLDGRTRELAHGSWEPRGVATDGERVFVSARRAGRVLVFRL